MKHGRGHRWIGCAVPLALHGWLELASAIEALRSAALTARDAGDAEEPAHGEICTP